VTCSRLPAENDDVCEICGDADVIWLELVEIGLSVENDDVIEILDVFDATWLKLVMYVEVSGVNDDVSSMCVWLSVANDDVGEDFDATWLELVTCVALSGDVM